MSFACLYVLSFLAHPIFMYETDELVTEISTMQQTKPVLLNFFIVQNKSLTNKILL